MVQDFDVIVVGAGGVGAAAAYHLARDGRRVLLLEQFALGHGRGSSHGGSRIIRYTHDTTEYVRLMPATFELWRALEAESGESLLQMAGGLYMGPEAQPFLVGARAALDALGHPFQVHTAPELMRRFPQFRVPADWIVLEQEQTGMLAASRCVATLARRAVHHGATLLEHTQVTRMGTGKAADQNLSVSVSSFAQHGSAGNSLEDGVTVETQSARGAETFRARQVVLCAGPWAGQFLAQWLPQLPTLRVTHQQVAYYQVANPARYAPGTFPVFLCAGENVIYGLPAWERPDAIKVALEQEARTVDPAAPDRQVDAHLLESLNHGVAYYLPEVDPVPVEVVPCLYTETPTRDFIIDRLPQFPQVLVAAGFSGRGFKHTIAVGRLLADLAGNLERTGPHDYTSDFWLDSFAISSHLSTMQPHIQPTLQPGVQPSALRAH